MCFEVSAYGVLVMFDMIGKWFAFFGITAAFFALYAWQEMRLNSHFHNERI